MLFRSERAPVRGRRGAGVSGSGPNFHDSTVTLSKLVPRIARYRDAFYQRLLKQLNSELSGNPTAASIHLGDIAIAVALLAACTPTPKAAVETTVRRTTIGRGSMRPLGLYLQIEGHVARRARSGRTMSIGGSASRAVRRRATDAGVAISVLKRQSQFWHGTGGRIEWCRAGRAGHSRRNAAVPSGR